MDYLYFDDAEGGGSLVFLLVVGFIEFFDGFECIAVGHRLQKLHFELLRYDVLQGNMHIAKTLWRYAFPYFLSVGKDSDGICFGTEIPHLHA